jgi:outer membrane lipoprotein-sorting protein
MENALDPEIALQCRAHLETCAGCRTEYTAINRLQERLILRGQAAAEVSLVEPVMRRIHGLPQHQESITFMSRLFTRWGFGMGAAVGTAAVALMFLLASPPDSKATASQVMSKGIQAAARLTGIHLQGRIRSRPSENFAYIDRREDFTGIELWREFDGAKRWRVEKAGRVAVMDGQATMLYFKQASQGFKFPPAQSAFDTDWLHRIANLQQTLESELRQAQAQGWKMTVISEPGSAGANQAVVAIEAKSGLPDGDYLKNKFFNTADTRRVYRFNEQTGQLEAAQVYLHDPAGDVLVFELTGIAYNPAIAPEVFKLDLPAGFVWNQELPILPDNAKYAAMTAEEAARAFFDACTGENWKEVSVFANGWDNDTMKLLGGLKLIGLGKAFGSAGYPGLFVPYEIQFKGGEVKKHNLALKKDAKTGRWFIDGGI